MAITVSEKIVTALQTGKDPTEITYLDSATPGTATASKAVVAGTSSEINGLLWRLRINADVAGTGSTVSDAAQLLEGFTVITGANGTLAWKLPATPVAGTIVIVKGTTAGVAKIFPDAAATINAIGSNGAISLASGAVPAIFVAKSATQWYTLPLLPS